jgi:phosphoglycolate phosphatase
MNSIQLVAFDLDGTLVDSMPDIARAVELMARKLGVTPPGMVQVREWVGDGVRRLMKRALTGTRDGEPPAELYRRGMESFRHHYREHLADESRLYPGARAVLDELRAAGVRLACITNKSGEVTAPLLQALDLGGYFAVVLSGDSLAQRKPDPEPLLHAARSLQVAPAQSCMVGDSANDIRAARAAGFRAVAVNYGYDNPAELAAAEPDVVLDSLAGLPDWLAKQGAGLAGRAASR